MLVGLYGTYLAGVADPGGIAFARFLQTHRHGSEGAFPLMAALAWHGLHPGTGRYASVYLTQERIYFTLRRINHNIKSRLEEQPKVKGAVALLRQYSDLVSAVCYYC